MRSKIGCGLLLAVLAAGCGEPAAPSAATSPPTKAGHDHSGWWCDEHGIPEAECSMCSPRAFRRLKAQGDVCDKHPDRAKSQCFICNPALEAEFAKRYRAKEGKEPPEPVGQRAGKG